MSTPAARLEVVAGNAAGTSILVEDEMVIGRHAEGAGRLADDEEISRAHARLTLDPSGVCEIEDLGSTNGTYVNGLRISGPEALSVGDTIELGQTTLAVRELPAPQRRSSSKLFFPEEELEEEAAEPPSSPAPVAAAPFHEEESEPDIYEQAASEPQTVPEPAQAMAEPGAQAMAEPGAQAMADPDAQAMAEPEPAPVPEPEALPAPEPEAAVPPLKLQLEVDLANREARVSLDHGSDPVRFTFEGGAWRVAPSAPREEGEPS